MRHAGFLLALVLLLGVACNDPTHRERTGTSRQTRSSDYREDQADRQTQRDVQGSTKKIRKPMDSHESSGQDVIDQPR